ncbi:MAG: hypothetical protein Q8N23_36220 [Archangium sp.]|nr:hypothetical protein [Archangium sp.]
MRSDLMRRVLLRAWPLLVSLAGCECSPFGVETTRFVCAAQADCIEGFECVDLGNGLECVANGTQADAGEVDAGGLDAGQDAGEVDAGVDAGASDAGVDAGAPVALRFATAAQTLVAGACSQIIALETVDDAGMVTPVTAATDVQLSGAPASVTFYTASNCAGAATTTLTIGANLTSVSFYASATPAGAFTVTADAPPLSGATQALTALNAPTSLVFTTTAPDPVRGGTCLAATVEARRSGMATPVAGSTTVGLSAAPSAGTRFYSDGSCTTSTTSVTITGGSTAATFFVKPLTAGANVITAAAPFGSANQTVNTTQVVRRGQCSFPTRMALPDGGTQGALSINCPVSPSVNDVNASFSLSQATAALSGSELGVAEVRCRLSSPSNLACWRREDADTAQVHWQVAEVPQGLLTQRSTAFNCPPTIPLTTPVDPVHAFVIKTVTNATATFDDEDMAVAELTAPNLVTLTPTQCNGHDVQVVAWDGVTVTRGMAIVPAGMATATVSGLAAASGERALLMQPGTAFNASRIICASTVRGAMPTATSIVLTRAGDPNCVALEMERVLYERLDFGGKAVVREYTASFTAGDLSDPVTISPVDTSRTLVFSGSQLAGGQGAGETNHDGVFRFTEALFRTVLTNATTVTVTRDDASSAALITFYVAELVP